MGGDRRAARTAERQHGVEAALRVQLLDNLGRAARHGFHGRTSIPGRRELLSIRAGGLGHLFARDVGLGERHAQDPCVDQ